MCIFQDVQPACRQHRKQLGRFKQSHFLLRFASTRPPCSCNSDSIGWEDTEQKLADVYPIPQQNLVVQSASPPLRQPASLGNSDSSGRRGPRLNTGQSLPDSQEKHDRAHLPATLLSARPQANAS